MSRPRTRAIEVSGGAEPDGVAAHCRDLLAPLGAVRIRRMFGGIGIYVDELFIAIIADGCLYLKTDPSTVDQFRNAGCRPFEYETREGRHTISYWSAPEEALETVDSMRRWALLAIDAARGAAQRQNRTRRRAGP
jgi:DNA transformation protein and related proteins